MTWVRAIFLSFFVFAGLINRTGSGLLAQAEIKAVHFHTPPVLDGSINDAIWKSAPAITEFVQREPATGEAFTEPTEVYIGFDSEFLYIGFRCFGDPDDITAKEMSRDVSLGNDDRVQIILDTYHDKRNAYWFQVGPRGSIGDAIVSENGAALNKAWDGLWTGKAHIHDQGWDAELAIPFKTLSFKKGQDIWGLKLIRNLMKKQETGYWPLANIDAYRFQVSDAGLLTGIKDISQGIGLDLVPYALTGSNYKRNSGPPKGVLDAGFDAYYNITPSIKAALTVNTDFAQTEVDNQQINLTRFNLKYPEKRDFFLDGANYFDFGINGESDNPYGDRLIPFFSRRIGLDSVGNPIPVLVGGKVTGQAGRWNLGFMQMLDERKDWDNNNFIAARVSRNFGGQSQVGIISTFGNALFDTKNNLLGLDMKLGTSSFRKDKNISMILYGLKSFTTHIQDNDMAFGGEILYPNDFLNFRIGHMQIGENFVAGLGFVPRPGVKESYLKAQVSPRPDRWGILQVFSNGGIDYITDFGNKLLTREINIVPIGFRMKSGDEFHFHLDWQYERLDVEFPVYGSYIIPAGNHYFTATKVDVFSAKHRDLWAGIMYSWGGFYDGYRRQTNLDLGYKVFVPLFVGAAIDRNDVSLSDGGFVAYVYRFNLNLLFGPDISLYSFIQYDNKSDRMGWQSRFRWILQPGREIFFVWNSIASDPYENYRTEEIDARLKIKYAIRF